MLKNLLFLSFLFAVTIVSAQPELVTDYHTGSEDAFDCFLCTEQPTARVRTGIVTVATSATTGAELCLLIDGQFSLLKDINPGAEDGRISLLTEREGLVYFTARDPENGGAVWVTDGSEDGTEVFFDPDTTNATSSITVMEFGADGALYVVFRSRLYRFFEGTGSELAGQVSLSTSNDNFPGGSLTTYRNGVAYISNEDEGFGGGLYYAADTVSLLAAIPGQSRFDQAFAPREVNGNLVFSLEGTGSGAARKGTYVYESEADTLRRYFDAAGESLFIGRWYELSDSLRVGRVNNGNSGNEYFLFDGLNAPEKLLDAGAYTLAARQTAPAVAVNDTLLWQTEGGTFNDIVISVTDGTTAGTATVFESSRARAMTNLLHAGGYVFFAATIGSRGPLEFYRYELATGELVNFYSIPEVTSGTSPNYSLQMLTVQDSKLYFAGNIDPTFGRELYVIDTEVEIVGNRNLGVAPRLEVAFTAETFEIKAERSGQARLTVLDMSGRLLERQTVDVNTLTRLTSFTGIRIYLFEYEDRVGVYRVLGR